MTRPRRRTVLSQRHPTLSQSQLPSKMAGSQHTILGQSAQVRSWLLWLGFAQGRNSLPPSLKVSCMPPQMLRFQTREPNKENTWILAYVYVCMSVQMTAQIHGYIGMQLECTLTYKYLHQCNSRTFVCVCIHVAIYTCIYVCRCICTCPCMCMCICVRVSRFVYACMYVCMHACMYVCMHACMFVCVLYVTVFGVHVRCKHRRTHAN